LISGPYFCVSKVIILVTNKNHVTYIKRWVWIYYHSYSFVIHAWEFVLLTFQFESMHCIYLNHACIGNNKVLMCMYFNKYIFCLLTHALVVNFKSIVLLKGGFRWSTWINTHQHTNWYFSPLDGVEFFI